jgi:hypothetical protein
LVHTAKDLGWGLKGANPFLYFELCLDHMARVNFIKLRTLFEIVVRDMCPRGFEFDGVGGGRAARQGQMENREDHKLESRHRDD